MEGKKRLVEQCQSRELKKPHAKSESQYETDQATSTGHKLLYIINYTTAVKRQV